MSGELVTAVLSEAFNRFGGFPASRQREISAWIRQRVQDIREGKDTAPPTVEPFAPSWYEPVEREPGSDDT